MRMEYLFWAAHKPSRLLSWGHVTIGAGQNLGILQTNDQPGEELVWRAENIKLSKKAYGNLGHMPLSDLTVETFLILRDILFNNGGSPKPIPLREKRNTQDDPLDEYVVTPSFRFRIGKDVEVSTQEG